jgi:hypothetical protein
MSTIKLGAGLAAYLIGALGQTLDGAFMSEDRELQAMGTVLAALQPLEEDEKKRVMQWLMQRLAVDFKGQGATGHQTQVSAPTGPISTYSTDTIATLIGASSGPELIIAAAAHLLFGQGKSTFTRRELTAQMRTSPARFKHTFINNLSAYLAGLAKADRLRMSGPDTYALSNRERQALQAKLAAAED